MNLDNAAILVPLFFFGLGVLWRASSLKADVVRDWGPRVNDAEVALDDRATQQLLALQQEIGSLLGVGSAQSLPLGAVADPSVLAERADDFRRTLRCRDRLQRHYRLMRWIGPGLIIISTAFLVGWLAIAVNDTELARGEGLRVAGIVLLAASAGFGVGFTFGYAFLNNRLANAEILGTTAIEPARRFK